MEAALTFEERLEKYDRALTKTERVISAFMLQHRDEIIFRTISDLSDETGTSDASIIRLCRKLGFRGFQDLKICVARDSVTASAQIHETISSADTPSSIIHKVFGSLKETLDSTEAILDSEELVKAGNAVFGARRIVVFGLGSSASVATDMAHKFMRIGYHATAYTDNHMQFLACCDLCEGDVAIGISHSGNSRDVVEALIFAREQGATTICFTNNGKSPITKKNVSDIKLLTASPETRYRVWGQASRIAQLAIADAIYVYVAFKKGEEAIKNIERVDKSLSCKKF